MKGLVEIVRKIFAALSRQVWIPILVARLAMAGEFMSSGWGKLHGLLKLTAYFTQLGIPMPGLNAAATATTELVGGTLLLLGLATRFAAAALAVVMTVAICTVTIKGAHTLGDFFYASEPAYWVIFLWLVFQGGGSASVDAWLARRLGGEKKPG
jgi:putative oxidoreductase